MVRGSCLLCRAGDNRWDQAFSTCHRRHDMLGQRTKARQRHASDGQQWLRPYMACFWCLNPQSVCRQANPETHVESSSCEENNLVLPLCDGIFDSAHDSGWLHDQFGRRFDTIAEYLDWLGKESSFGGDWTIQAVRVAAAALADFRAASSAPILPRCLHTIDWYDSSTTLGFGLWYTQLLLVPTLGCEDNKDSRRGRSSWIRSNRNGGVKSAPSKASERGAPRGRLAVVAEENPLRSLGTLSQPHSVPETIACLRCPRRAHTQSRRQALRL